MNIRYPPVLLADLASDISYGYTASASQEPIGPQFLRITDIVSERLDWNTVPYCAISDRDRVKHRLETGDIVIARTGATVGHSKYIDKPPDAVYASYLVRVRISLDYDARFVGYVVGSREYKEFVLANAGGAAQPNASARVLTSYPVPLPPLRVQRRIASILSAYDDLIENNTRRIQILEEMAQAIYREWFVEFRFPGHEGVRMVDSELGPIPEEWEVSALAGVLARHIGGGWGSEKAAGKHAHMGRVIRGTDIPRVNVLDLSTTPIRFHEASNLGKRTLAPGDVIIEVSGGSSDQAVGRAAYVSPELLEASGMPTICASFCKLLRTQQGFSSLLLYWHFRHLYESRGIEEYQVQSTGIKNLRFKQLADADLLPVPDPSIQAKFEEMLAPMMSLLATLGGANTALRRTRDLLIENLGLATRNLRATRDLLLPRLISGEIDVSNLDIGNAEPAA